jgi:GNAT superfamily N-acetyltransferase
MDLERAEIAAVRDVFRAAPPALAAQLGIEMKELRTGVATKVAAFSGVRELNRVTGLESADPLPEVEAFYGDVSYVVALSPAGRKAGLEDRLRSRGFSPDYAWMKFSRPTHRRFDASTDLRIEEVGADRGRDFGMVVCRGYGMPHPMLDWLAAVPGRRGWRCFLAYHGETPAAAGAVQATGEEAWLGFAATLPEFRGRGGQGALLAARLGAAAEAGCRVATTETGVRSDGRPAASYRNILRSGFTEAWERPNWRSPAGERLPGEAAA